MRISDWSSDVCSSDLNEDATDEGGLREVLNLVVLDESGIKRNADFEWETVERYRVLQLGDMGLNEVEGVYKKGLFQNDVGTGLTFDETRMVPPRTEERRVGEEWCRQVKSRWATVH